MSAFDQRRYAPGVPCSHPGCLSHVTHPCEGCGRIAGRYPPTPAAPVPPGEPPARVEYYIVDAQGDESSIEDATVDELREEARRCDTDPRYAEVAPHRVMKRTITEEDVTNGGD